MTRDLGHIEKESTPLLEKVAKVIEEVGPSEIRVEGHTDSVGDPVYNQYLSKKRADSVAEVLRDENDIDVEIETVGLGVTRPIADNKSREGRSLNRRVDII